MAGAPLAPLPDFEGGDAGRQLATMFQQALLPPIESLNPAVHCETRYRPGERRLLLGGDFLDVVDTPRGDVAFVIGDVAGHGPLAAAVALAMRASWRTLALGDADLVSWLVRMDQVLSGLPRSEEMFVTVCVGIIDSDCMTGCIASAGHPPPILLTDVASPVHVKPSTPLGISPGEQDPDVSDVVLGTDWGLLVYTDGLIEGRRAPGSPERYGIESLTGWLSTGDVARLDARRLDQLIVDVEAANGGPIDDDLAVLLLSSHPSGEAVVAQ